LRKKDENMGTGNKSVVKHIRFDEEETDQIEREAKQQGRTFSQQVRYMAKLFFMSNRVATKQKDSGK